MEEVIKEEPSSTTSAAIEDVGTKRPRDTLQKEDSMNEGKNSKRAVNGTENESRDIVVILDAGAQYGKV